MFHYYKYIIRQKYEKIINYTLSFKARYIAQILAINLLI